MKYRTVFFRINWDYPISHINDVYQLLFEKIDKEENDEDLKYKEILNENQNGNVTEFIVLFEVSE